jgi:predicted DNA-binding protein
METEKRRPGRPATGHDSTFSVRAPVDLRQRAAAIAKRRGETVSDVVRRALENYVRRHGREEGQKP